MDGNNVPKHHITSYVERKLGLETTRDCPDAPPVVRLETVYSRRPPVFRLETVVQPFKIAPDFLYPMQHQAALEAA